MIRTTAFLATCLLLLPAQRAFAETSNCTEIASLPAAINSQGVFCLRRDLSTSITTGNAIAISANNVTIDCNGWKIGGLGGGPGTRAIGIHAEGRKNVAIRNCGVRGFEIAIALGGEGSAYHLVENNRIDLSTQTGVEVAGDGYTVRGNRLYDIGDSTGNATGIAAYGSGSVIDNTVQGVLGGVSLGEHGYGIDVDAPGGAFVSGNRVLNSVGDTGYGMRLDGPISAIGNSVILSEFDRVSMYVAFLCQNAVALRDNVVIGFPQPGHALIGACMDAGNVVHQPPV